MGGARRDMAALEVLDRAVLDRRLLADLSLSPADVLQELARSLAGRVRGDTVYWSGMFAAVQATPVGIADDVDFRYGVRPRITVTFRRLPDGPERIGLDEATYEAENERDLAQAMAAVVALLDQHHGDALVLAIDGDDNLLLERRGDSLRIAEG